MTRPAARGTIADRAAPPPVPPLRIEGYSQRSWRGARRVAWETSRCGRGSRPWPQARAQTGRPRKRRSKGATCRRRPARRCPARRRPACGGRRAALPADDTRRLRREREGHGESGSRARAVLARMQQRREDRVHYLPDSWPAGHRETEYLGGGSLVRAGSRFARAHPELLGARSVATMRLRHACGKQLRREGDDAASSGWRE